MSISDELEKRINGSTDLLAAAVECERLRRLAHEAPMNPLRTDHDGHRWIEPQSEAWRHRGREWMEACDRALAIRRKIIVDFMAEEMRKVGVGRAAG